MSARRAALALALATFAGTGLATAAVTRVGYLAGGSAYVEAGRMEGLREGDTLEVFRDGARVGRLRINFLSSHRAACDTLGMVSPLRIGDEVRFTARAAPTTPSPMADSSSAPAPSLPPATERPTQPRTWRGRVGLRYVGVSGSGGGALRQPALDVRVDGRSIAGLPIEVSADVRGRHTSWTRADGSSENSGQARVYRLSMLVTGNDGRLRASAGRLTSPTFASVSLFDGGLFEVVGSRWSTGVFAGTQPEPAHLGVSSRILEGGGFVGLRSIAGEERRWRVDLGGVTSLQDGQPNRDFLFLQGSLQDRRVSAFATQEADVNRGWKAESEPVMALTSTFTLVRVQVIEALSIQGGFDNRRSVRLYRDRATPETEFDDRYRQGGWGGAIADLGRHVRVGGDWRVRSGADASDTWSASAEAHALGALQFAVRGRFSAYRGDDVDSDLSSASLGFDPWPGSHLEGSGGTRTTRDLDTGLEENVSWYGVDADVALSRRVYLTGSFESDHGGFADSRQGSAGLSWRF